MDNNTPPPRSSRWAYLVAAAIFASGGLILMFHSLSSGSGDFVAGLAVLGFAYLAIREGRKDDHVA